MARQRVHSGPGFSAGPLFVFAGELFSAPSVACSPARSAETYAREDRSRDCRWLKIKRSLKRRFERYALRWIHRKRDAMRKYLRDHGLPLVQLKERRRELIIALQNRAEPISNTELAQIAAIQQTITAIEDVISDLDGEILELAA